MTAFNSKISIRFVGVLEIESDSEHNARLANGAFLRTIVSKLQTFVGADVNGVRSNVQLTVPIPSEVVPPGPNRAYEIGNNFSLIGDLVVDSQTEHDAREAIAVLEAEILEEITLWPVTEMEILEVTASVH